MLKFWGFLGLRRRVLYFKDFQEIFGRRGHPIFPLISPKKAGGRSIWPFLEWQRERERERVKSFGRCEDFLHQ